ncbi:hypothetical protein EIN_222050 [Entamoeba invadens IP1]|uniref:Uncharacterized protein n=1 Tax=Entamoeba invadens IP1 TaxID=370355 RepID=A0A0A1U201_ENTIV|nr:hypothetical protein EIN_222050 [Entamoeba invadens IP1]ELP88072.1 hypothetical protein EIN_222050 [Entamoeba invadens IP1]|eukprot:XP_004254843.1 hypothetical protein EIN_222050 [Entamoeba invadens IP1]
MNFNSDINENYFTTMEGYDSYTSYIHIPVSTEVNENNIKLLGNIFTKPTFIPPEVTSPNIPLCKKEEGTMVMDIEEGCNVVKQSPVIVMDGVEIVMDESNRDRIDKIQKNVPWNCTLKRSEELSFEFSTIIPQTDVHKECRKLAEDLLTTSQIYSDLAREKRFTQEKKNFVFSTFHKLGFEDLIVSVHRTKRVVTAVEPLD